MLNLIKIQVLSGDGGKRDKKVDKCTEIILVMDDKSKLNKERQERGDISLN